MKKPNILFLMCDEHRFDVLGYAGNRIIKTPVLDSLAKQAVVFNNAYTPSPICIPARQCLMSGCLPKHCGCEEYGQDLPAGSMTFARCLAAAGYETVACGKLHHMGTDQMQGWTMRMGADIKIDPHYIPGYTRQTSAQADYKIAGFEKWSNAKEIKRAGVGENCASQAADSYALSGALNFIKDRFVDAYYDRANTEQPLLLKVSFNRPHYPYFTSERLFSYYLNRVPLYDKDTVFDHPFLSRHRVQIGKDVSEREARRAVAAYYGMIESADSDFGTIIEALEHAGQNIDDWIIIYTSDHGEMLGQHGVWEKQKFFEASVKVPLFIRWPKKFTAHRVEKNVNLCDIFATLCELTGTNVPEGLDSRSLVPLMETAGAPWDNETVSHFKDVGGFANVMIKKDNLKYQYYGETDSEVLFDLLKNPTETQNFIDDDTYCEAVRRFRLKKNELGY